ncbi:MAG: hypothetical protein EOP85_04075 [Verrucomicrobiaceae bacterium]|nr:MAG: hypothetical protein EOP85_04075 [Verrucomicrobiaceae bacterium]
MTTSPDTIPATTSTDTILLNLAARYAELETREKKLEADPNVSSSKNRLELIVTKARLMEASRAITKNTSHVSLGSILMGAMSGRRGDDIKNLSLGLSRMSDVSFTLLTEASRTVTKLQAAYTKSPTRRNLLKLYSASAVVVALAQECAAYAPTTLFESAYTSGPPATYAEVKVLLKAAKAAHKGLEKQLLA